MTDLVKQKGPDAIENSQRHYSNRDPRDTHTWRHGLGTQALC